MSEAKSICASEEKPVIERLKCSFRNVGRRLGILTQVGPTFVIPFPAATKRRVAVFSCDCGSVSVVNAGNVATGGSASCGCLLVKSKTQHGQSDTPTYNSWKSMIRRCYSKQHPKYANYGGRGIKVCERWHDFQAFLDDMGERPLGTSIDRFPNQDGNYEPGNCRWATRHEQRLNARNALFLTIGGVTKTAHEWSLEQGSVGYDCLIKRIARGWPHDKAVFLPKQKAGGRGNKWST